MSLAIPAWFRVAGLVRQPPRSLGDLTFAKTAKVGRRPLPRPSRLYSKVATLNTTLKGMQYMTAEPNESRSAPGGIS